jgi:pyruvate dehydrogenase E1 component alpha subunit
VALGTTLEQHGAGDLARTPDAYGLPGWRVDGNNVLDVMAATRLAVERCRTGEGPVCLVAETFRMGGHATHDEREARETFPRELFEHWGRRDPIGMYEAWLLQGGFDAARLAAVEEAVTTEVEAAAEKALESKDRLPAPESALFEGVSGGGTLLGLEVRPI